MKCTTPSFTVELPLRIDDENERFLSTAFDLGCSIYNATLRSAMECLKRMRNSPSWQEACAMQKGPERNKRLNALLYTYGLTEFKLKTTANNHRKKSGRNQLGAHEAQCLGRTVYRALERYLFKKGGKPRFKSRKQGLNSIEGTDNREIIYKPEQKAIYWRKHRLPIIWKETPWLKAALHECSAPTRPRRVKFCRIVRKSIKGRTRWFVQLCVEGVPPKRSNYAPVSEVMGIDPGPSKIAYFHPQEAAIKMVAPNVDTKAAELRRLQRQIDRSLRANNPDNYEDDGRVKKGARKWKVSNRCARLFAKLKEQYRAAAETRKRDHGTLINQLLQRAGTIKIEKNSYKSYQRNFGRSTQRSGMGMFVQRLKSKAASAGCVVIELDARALKMSQYDPPTDTYTKKPLKQRWHRWGHTDTLVQRDIMSAYLACYVTSNGHDRRLLLDKWQAAEALLSDSGLCRHQLRTIEAITDVPRLTSPEFPGTGKGSVANSESA